MCICVHIFFLHSSVSGYLDCFHVLAVINSTAMNVDECVYFHFNVVQMYAQEWNFWIIWHLYF